MIVIATALYIMMQIINDQDPQATFWDFHSAHATVAPIHYNMTNATHVVNVTPVNNADADATMHIGEAPQP